MAKFKLRGMSFLLGVLSVVAVFFFLKSLNVLLDGYIFDHALGTVIVSGLIITALILMEIISFTKLWRRQFS